MWPVNHLALSEASAVELKDRNGKSLITLRPDTIKRILLAKLRIARTSGVWAEFLFIEGDDPNAFAGQIRKPGAARAALKPVIGINVGMLKLLGDDVDAAAALLGHEAAHLAKNHGKASRTRRSTLLAAGYLAELGLGFAGVPMAGTITGYAVELIDTAYDRDEEREADTLGVDYMVAEGYDPEGAVRLWEKMKASAGIGHKVTETLLPFLSTHPTNDERLEYIARLAAEKRDGPVVAASPGTGGSAAADTAAEPVSGPRGTTEADTEALE